MANKQEVIAELERRGYGNKPAFQELKRRYSSSGGVGELEQPAQVQAPDKFTQDYTTWAKKNGINENPDDPQQMYHYRDYYAKYGSFPETPGHLSAEFKFTKEKDGVDHPTRYVGGLDTTMEHSDEEILSQYKGDKVSAEKDGWILSSAVPVSAPSSLDTSTPQAPQVSDPDSLSGQLPPERLTKAPKLVPSVSGELMFDDGQGTIEAPKPKEYSSFGAELSTAIKRSSAGIAEAFLGSIANKPFAAQNMAAYKNAPQNQPAYNGGKAGTVANFTGEVLPQLAAGAIPGVGLLTVGQMEKQGGEDLAKELGLTIPQQEMAGGIVGAVNMIIEGGQVGILLKAVGLDDAAKAALKTTASKNIIKRLLQNKGQITKAGLTSALNGGLEEALQQTVTIATPEVIQGKNPVPALWEKRGEIGGSFVGGAIAEGSLGGGGRALNIALTSPDEAPSSATPTTPAVEPPTPTPAPVNTPIPAIAQMGQDVTNQTRIAAMQQGGKAAKIKVVLDDLRTKMAASAKDAAFQEALKRKAKRDIEEIQADTVDQEPVETPTAAVEPTDTTQITDTTQSFLPPETPGAVASPTTAPVEESPWNRETTDYPIADSALKNGTASIVEMSPNQYIKMAAETQGVSHEESIKSIDWSRVDKYARQMKKGDKFPMLVIEKGTQNQEGRHRALAAEELFRQTGVRVNVPVVIMEPSSTPPAPVGESDQSPDVSKKTESIDATPAVKPKEAWEMTKDEFESNINGLVLADKVTLEKVIVHAQDMLSSGRKLISDTGEDLRPLFEKDLLGAKNELSKFNHKEVVRKALSEGKPVPAEVLAEYPDLSPAKPVETPAPDAEEIFIRLAEKGEKNRPQKAMQDIPAKEGYRAAYKPYGSQGKGFYYVKDKRKGRSNAPNNTPVSSSVSPAVPAAVADSTSTPIPYTPSANPVIEKIVQASRDKEPKYTIQARPELLGSDGKWYSPMGFPGSVKPVGESRTAGYALVDQNGSAYGTRYKTKEEAETATKQRQDNRATSFKDQLEKMKPAELQSQATFWLGKDAAPVEVETVLASDQTGAAANIRKILSDYSSSSNGTLGYKAALKAVGDNLSAFVEEASTVDETFPASLFTDKENTEINKISVENAANYYVTHPKNGKSLLSTEILDTLKEMIVDNRRMTYKNNLKDRFDTEIPANEYRKDFRNTVNNVHNATKDYVDSLYEKLKKESQDAAKKGAEEDAAAAELEKAKAEQFAALNYKTKEDLPSYRSAKDSAPDVLVSTAEVSLKRKLSNLEAIAIQRKAWGGSQLAKGEYGPDFLFMVANSTFFPKKMRSDVVEYLTKTYGQIKLTANKSYAQKVVKGKEALLKVVGEFKSEDGKRYSGMSGYFAAENGDVVATNGHILIRVPDGNKITNNPVGKSYTFEGQEIEGSFPKYEDIMPMDARKLYTLEKSHVEKILNILDNSITSEILANNYDGTAPATFSIGDRDIQVNPDYFDTSLKALLKLGSETIEVQGTVFGRPLLLIGKDAQGNKIADVVIMQVNPGESTLNIQDEMPTPVWEKPAENTVFTEAKKDAAVARQKSKAAKTPKGKSTGQIQIFTAEDIKDAITILGYYVEKGTRTAKFFVDKAIETYGEPIRKHLPEIWASVKAELNITEDLPPDGTTPPTPTPPPAPVSPAPEVPGTSIKNEAVQAKRSTYGLPALQESEVLSDQAVLDKASETVKANPLAGKMLVDELRGKLRTVSVDEEGLLLHRMVELENERNLLDTKMIEAIQTDNVEDRRMIGNMIIAVSDAYQELTDITKAVGRDIARALRFRQRFVSENYTLLKMETRMQAAQGRPLSEADRKEIAGLHARLTEANTKLKEALEADTAAQARIKELEAQKFVEASKAASKRRTSPAPRYGSRNRIVSEERHLKNRAEFKALVSGQLNAGIDPRLLRIAVEEGIYHLEAIGRKAGASVEEMYKDWSNRMKVNLGDAVTPYLKPAWDQANTRILTDDRDVLVEKLTTVQNGDSDRKDAEIGRLIKKLAENFIASGQTELDPLISQVHDVVKTNIPEMSWEDVLNTFADYGKYRPLDHDELKAAVRDKRRQALQLSKLFALYKKQPLQKTGFDRGEPSDIERELIKLVNEAKKEYGIDTTDPETQLKSALDAVKTRLRNEITDLDKQIASGEKIVDNRAKLAYDAEALRLKQIRDFKKQQFDEIFADPAAEDAKKVSASILAVEKSILEYEDKISRGDIAVKAKKEGPTSAELDLLRKKRDSLRETVRQLREAQKPKKTDEQRIIERINNRIAEYEDRLNREDYSKKPRKERLMTPAINSRQAAVDRIKREFDEKAYEAIMANKPFLEKLASFTINIGGVIKSLLAGGEVSGIGRQLLPSAFVDMSTYRTAVEDTLKAYKNPDYAKDLEVYVENHPKYMASKKWGNIQYTKVGIPGYEEFLPSRLPEKIPLIGQLYKRGDAAFAAPQNKNRLGLWDILTDEYSREGKLSSGYNLSPTVEDIRVMKRLGGWINDLSGRSSLGRSNAMRQMGTFLNLVGFAPRYTFAKIKLTLGFGGFRSVLPSIEKVKGVDGKERYALKSNFDRILMGRSAKAMGKFIAVNTAIASIAYLANPDDNEDIFNPLSSNFYKVKIGNTRFDFTVGIAAMVRLFAQLYTGERKEASGRYSKEKRKEIFGRFIQSKEAPLLGLIVTLWTGEDFVGKPISAGEAIANSITMMFLNDAYDAYKNSGTGMAILALGAGAVGIGVQSYPDSASSELKRIQDTLSKETFGKMWDDLKPTEQSKLSNNTVLKGMELKRKQGKLETPTEYKQPQAEFDAGKRLFDGLPPSGQAKLTAFGIKTMPLARKIGASIPDGINPNGTPKTKSIDFYLNDQRYKAYEDAFAAELAKVNFSYLNSEEIAQKVIKNKKEIARNAILRRINVGQL